MPLVLLLEVDAEVRTLVRRTLEAASYRVIAADSGPEAATRAAEQLPEFILVGRLARPAELGALLATLREHPMTAASPVLFIPRPEEVDFREFLDHLPSTWLEERPAWQPRVGGPDLSVLPRSMRVSLANLLAEGRRLSVEARYMPVERAQKLGVTIQEAGRLLDRLGISIGNRPDLKPEGELVTELSVPLFADLQERASRMGRSYALYLSLEPTSWRGDPALFIDPIGAVVESLLHESPVAISLKVEASEIRLTILADELFLSEPELADISRAQRQGAASSYRGRFRQLLDLAAVGGGTLRLHAGPRPGVKFSVVIPHRVPENVWSEGQD